MNLEGFCMGTLAISYRCLYFALISKMCSCGIDKATIINTSTSEGVCGVYGVVHEGMDNSLLIGDLPCGGPIIPVKLLSIVPIPS